MPSRFRFTTIQSLITSVACLLLAFSVTASVQAEDFPGAPAAPAGFKTFAEFQQAYVAGKIERVQDPKVIPDSITLHEDIEFSNVEGHSLKLDLFVPRGLKTKTPCLVFIHGGGWRKGKKENYRRYCVDFAERGYITASISYRLSKVAKFPAAVIDVKNGVRWVRAHASEYQIDPEEIAVVGGSAGGHLALMVGFADDQGFESEESYKDVSSGVKAVVNIYGVADMTTERAKSAFQVLKFMGKKYEEAEEAYRLASPITHLTADGPPTLSIHGSIDELVPLSQSEKLHARLEELGVENALDVVKGWPHSMDVNVGVNKRCQYIMHEFFKKHLPLPQ